MASRTVITALAVAVALAGCGGGDDTSTTREPTTSSTGAAPTTPTAIPVKSPCGVTLAEVQALLPPGSGVTQNATPDPGRCNFTWNDGGPRGIDVAIVPGGRSSFKVPSGYQPLDGYGEQAFTSSTNGRASAFAFAGDNLYAADVVADGTGATEAQLRDLCLRLLRLALY